MNKFEKKAMAKRAYRALVKMAGDYAFRQSTGWGNYDKNVLDAIDNLERHQSQQLEDESNAWFVDQGLKDLALARRMEASDTDGTYQGRIAELRQGGRDQIQTGARPYLQNRPARKLPPFITNAKPIDPNAPLPPGVIELDLGNTWRTGPGSERILPDMMTRNEFYYNGMKGDYDPRWPLGVTTSIYKNTARLNEIPEDDHVNRRIVQENPRTFFDPDYKRPYGPLLSPLQAITMERNLSKPDLITGLTPRQTYQLTGGRSYIPDSINLDDTPEF